MRFVALFEPPLELYVDAAGMFNGRGQSQVMAASGLRRKVVHDRFADAVVIGLDLQILAKTAATPANPFPSNEPIGRDT